MEQFHRGLTRWIGRRMGHEAIGVVEAVGADLRKVKKGDFVVMPFAYSDGSSAGSLMKRLDRRV